MLLGVIAGCGGGDSTSSDDESATGEVEAVQGIVELDATLSDPTLCGRIQTDRYLLQATFTKDRERAGKVCRESVRLGGDSADSIEFESVDVDGDTATAVSETIGGSNEGLTLTHELVLVNGDWRMDRLVDVEVDREAYDAAQIEYLSEAEKLSRAASVCTTELLASQVSDGELARGLIDADDSIFFPEGGVRCLGLLGGVDGERGAAAIIEAPADEAPALEADPDVSASTYRGDAALICSEAAVEIEELRLRTVRRTREEDRDEQPAITADFLEGRADFIEAEVEELGSLPTPPKLVDRADAYLAAELEFVANQRNLAELFAGPIETFSGPQVDALTRDEARLLEVSSGARLELAIDCSKTPRATPTAPA